MTIFTISVFCLFYTNHMFSDFPIKKSCLIPKGETVFFHTENYTVGVFAKVSLIQLIFVEIEDAQSSALGAERGKS